MKTVYVFLAEGFEEIEAIAPIDILRRGGVTVKTVGVTGGTVAGAHGIPVVADISAKGFALPDDADMVVLPGGGGGTQNLLASGLVAQMLTKADARGIFIAAICAAPMVLHKAGLLRGKRATAFPSVQAELVDSTVTGAAVERDGVIITGRSAGVALQFGKTLLAALEGDAAADAVLADMYP